eukprot:g7959.t1
MAADQNQMAVPADADAEANLAGGGAAGGGGAAAVGAGAGAGAGAGESQQNAAGVKVPSVAGTAAWHKPDEKAEDEPIPPRSDAGPKGRPPRSYHTARWECPPLFRPVRISSDPPGSDGVSLDELLAGEYTEALVSSYLVDVEFLLKTVPRLKKVPFLLIQGVKEEKQLVINMKAYLRREHPKAVVHLPKTIHIGLHHSKIVLLKYKTGLRVVIMTSNMRPDDWDSRCQAAWYQDFPFKPPPPEKTRGKGKGKGKQKRKRGADDEPEEPEEREGEGGRGAAGGEAAAGKRRRVDRGEGGGAGGAAAMDEEEEEEGGGKGDGGGARVQAGDKRKRRDSDTGEQSEEKEEEREGQEEEKEEEEEDEKDTDDEEVVITSEFEEILIDYFEHVGGPAVEWARSLAAYDFSAANVTLIPSVPGRHEGKNLYKYGHMRVRRVLQREEVHVRPGSHRVTFQIAAIMNLSRRPYKWLGEMTESFMAEKVSSNKGEDGKKLTSAVDYVSPEEAERRRVQKAEEEKKTGNKPKKPLGQRKDPWVDKGILEKRQERAERREAIHRRNVLGLLPEKKPKPPKRLGKKAMKRKRREEREAAAAAALIKWVGKERKRNWFFDFLRIVWPTDEAVRMSNLGWESGAGMPCLTTSLYEGGYRRCDVNYNLNRVMEELKPILCTWTGAQGMNRHLSMPHLNTYYRYREVKRSDGSLKMSKDGLAYFLLGSHSLHRIAWGYLEHRNPPQRPRKRRVRIKPVYPPKPENTLPYKEEEVQLNIKSFDISVLLLPSKIPPKRSLPMDYDSEDSDNQEAVAAGAGLEPPPPFSCDPEGVLFQEKRLSYRCPERTPGPRLKTLPLGLLPIPHQLPAPHYEYSRIFGYRVVDRPWVWNRNVSKKDIFGKTIQLAKEKRRVRCTALGTHYMNQLSETEARQATGTTRYVGGGEENKRGGGIYSSGRSSVG